LFKKVSVYFLVSILTLSLFLNYYQYGQLSQFKNKQDSINQELKAQVHSAITNLEPIANESKEWNTDTNREYLRGQMNFITMLRSYSSYCQEQIVWDAFYRLQKSIYLIENLSADEVRNIILILEEIIAPEGTEVDIEACKKLADYIISISS
jgi:hypothetical protein